MIKIEKLNAAKAVFSRNGGPEQPVFLHLLLNREEYNTLRVLEGSVVVSIDEQEVVTISADGQQPQAAEVVEQPKSVEQSQPAVEAPAPVAAAPTPKTIVRPKPRTVTK